MVNIMSFIIDRAAYQTAILYAASGYEIIARLYLKKAYGVK
jgi:hypothetical protein